MRLLLLASTLAVYHQARRQLQYGADHDNLAGAQNAASPAAPLSPPGYPSNESDVRHAPGYHGLELGLAMVVVLAVVSCCVVTICNCLRLSSVLVRGHSLQESRSVAPSGGSVDHTAVKMHSWDAEDPRDPVIVVMPDNTINMAVMPPEDIPPRPPPSHQPSSTEGSNAISVAPPTPPRVVAASAVGRLCGCFSGAGSVRANHRDASDSPPHRLEMSRSAFYNGEHGMVTADARNADAAESWRAYRFRRRSDPDPHAAGASHGGRPSTPGRGRERRRGRDSDELEFPWSFVGAHARGDLEAPRRPRARALRARTRPRPRSLEPASGSARTFDMLDGWRLESTEAFSHRFSHQRLDRRARQLRRSDRFVRHTTSLPGTSRHARRSRERDVLPVCTIWLDPDVLSEQMSTSQALAHTLDDPTRGPRLGNSPVDFFLQRQQHPHGLADDISDGFTDSHCSAPLPSLPQPNDSASSRDERGRRPANGPAVAAAPLSAASAAPPAPAAASAPLPPISCEHPVLPRSP